MSIKDAITSNIIFLQDHQQSNYSRIPLEHVARLSEPLKIYKREVGKDGVYAAYKTEIKKLRSSKLHLRIIDIVKGCNKKGQRLPESLQQKLPQEILINCLSAKKDKKTHFQELERWLVQNVVPTSPAVSIAQAFKWGHGTNSSVLAMLEELDFTFMSTGEMLQRGVTPMSGELLSGGMFTTGVNQKSISAVPIEDISRAWTQYASKADYHFPIEKYRDLEPAFLSDLEALMAVSPDDNKWDELIISLLRAKQWKPEAFASLCAKHQRGIEELKQRIIKRCSYREHSILKALDWDLDDLKFACTNETRRAFVVTELGIERESLPGRNVLAWYEDKSGTTVMTSACQGYFLKGIDKHWKTIVTLILKARVYGIIKGPNEFEREVKIKSCQRDEQMLREMMAARIRKNMIPFERRYQRLLNVFDSPCRVHLKDEDRDMITSPFPILFASTKTKATAHSSKTEVLIDHAQLGKDIDLIFVRPENIGQMQQWLLQHDLNEKVTVYSSECIPLIASLPLCHGPDQVIDPSPYLSVEEQKLVSKLLEQKVLPLYRVLYPNGMKRIHHGVMHALRAALLAQVLAELYRKESVPLNVKLAILIYATGLHDAERENDGEDMWDAKSGKKCEEVLIELGVDPLIAALFNVAIADKESLSPHSLAHKILHDADCLEILRFLKSLEKFQFEKLWAFKELDRDTVIAFAKEVNRFIALTENEQLKEYIENSEHPYPAIVQVLSYAHDLTGQFPQMTDCLQSALQAFAVPSSGVPPLPLEIQSLIKEVLKEKT